MKYNAFPILLATTFLSTPAVAQTVPTINTDFLNSLTGEKVTWKDASASREDTVQIGDKFYKYTYHKPDNYTETSERIDDTLSTSDVTDILFSGICSTSNGGAIYNTQDDSIDIKADFVSNYINANNGRADGGAIYNSATIGYITGDFIRNDTASESYFVVGGAIMNNGIIGNIIGNFIGNYSASQWSSAVSGAIDNGGFIGGIIGNFIGNHSSSTGAIHNSGSVVDIIGNFVGNHSSSTGAIYNSGTIGNITGDFINNHSTSSYASGAGAFFNSFGVYDNGIPSSAIVGEISGSFIKNYVKADSTNVLGIGGAIYTDSDLTFKADGKTHLFTGNYIEYENEEIVNNAIWVGGRKGGSYRATLTFKLQNSGAFIFDDEIDGAQWNYVFIEEEKDVFQIWERDGYGYNINIYGDAYNTSEMDETNTIRFNDLVNNVYDFSLDAVQMALGKNAVINVTHNYIAQNNPYLRLDLDAVNREVGQINIEGDVEGTTNVIVNVLQNKETAKENSIVFATAQNDTQGGDDSFKIYRVIGSPYMWEVSYNDTNKQWGLYSTEEQNPDEEDDPDEPTPDTPVQPLGPIKVAPEVIATVAVKTAGLSQTNGMIYNIMRKVGINHLYCPGCGFYDYNWNGKTLHNAWADTTYNGLTIEAPVEIEAKVWGIEAGSDLQHDLNNKLGIFVSYRQGNYEMDGTGEKYYSNIGSEIDIDSYLAGLYYRYDKNNWYAFATVYGGMQNAEIKTDDGVSADTDGIEFGGSIEAGYSYALTGTLSATPSLGVFYSQISYDDATDSVGKTVNYNDLKQVELEAGIKFSQAEYLEDGFYAVYVKPSVVQTLIDGDEIEVTKLGKVDTIEDKSLGRVEIGANYGFNNNWSIYSWANYTFGSSYDATSLGAGVNYAW